MFPTIDFFGRVIGSYALLAFIGLIVCGAVVYFSCKSLKIAIEDVVILILVIAAGLVIGGHLLYGLTNISSIIKLLENLQKFNTKEIVRALSTIFGGMVFYGGFLGSLVSLKIYQNFSKTNFSKDIFDIYAFSTPLFHVFGRIGCFFAGCCYGIECGFGFTVTNNELVPAINNVKRFPVSLLEALCNLILFIVLLTMFKKKIARFKLIYYYMLLYSIIRFCTEFLRGDEIRGFVWIFSTSQWISIILFTVAIINLIPHKKSPKGS